MASSQFPDALTMRDWKYGGRSAEERVALATRLRDVGRRSEALLLFEHDPANPFLEAEITWARENGIGFHLANMRSVGVEISPDAWRDCAQVAESRGRFMDARTCYVALEDTAALERINPHLPPSLRVAIPADEN